MTRHHLVMCFKFQQIGMSNGASGQGLSGGAKNAAELAIFVSQLAIFAVT